MGLIGKSANEPLPIIWLSIPPFRQGRVVFFARKTFAKNLHPPLDLTICYPH